MKKAQERKIKKLDKVDIFVIVALSVYALVIFYPFYNAALSSIVSVREYSHNPAMIWPKEIILDNYEFMLENTNIVRGYANTLFIVIVGTALSMLITVAMAYVFSRKNLRGKKILFWIALFTMFFYGGLIPTYLNIKDLGLMNNLWAIVLMYSVNTYYMVLIKSSFEQIPEALAEAAKIDGANDITIFFRIMLPTVLPTLVTFGLFIAVDYWNEWYFSMLLVKDTTLKPLQVMLRDIVAYSTVNLQGAAGGISAKVFADGIKMATVVATMLPIMIVYPFLQKYFIKGITVGEVMM